MSSRSDKPAAALDKLLGVIWLLAGFGAVLAGYLWWLRKYQAVHPGCHASGDCSYLWFSPWANWFGLPVSALALIPYALIFLGTLLVIRKVQAETGRKLLTSLVFFLLVMVVWFVVLQGVVLKQWCRLCLLSHAVSAVLSFMVLAWLKKSSVQAGLKGWFSGSFAVVGLALGLAAIAGHSLPGQQTEDQSFHPLPGIVLIQREAPERVRIFGRSIDLKSGGLLVAGSPAARELMVTLFDYTCPDCRRLHGQLRHITAADPGRYCELVLPAPLHSACNPLVKQDTPLHANACPLAQIACVVGRFQPVAFPEFHAWLMAGEEPPAVESALQRAQALLPGLDVALEMKNQVNLGPLQLGVQIFQSTREIHQLDGLPLLMTEKATFIGAPQNIDTLARLLK